MALTKTPIELSSTPGIVDNSNATAITIDNSENVGIGGAPSTTLTVVGSGDAETGATITHSRSGVGYSLLLNNTNNGANKGSGIKWQGGGFDTAAIIGRSDATAASGDAPGYLTFHTSADGSEGLNERMRILSTGGITFNGDTAQANALDDYEEGVWTPVPVGLGTSGGTYTGFYTKTGRIVNWSCYILLPTTSDTSFAVFGGLPFPSTGGNGTTGNSGVSYKNSTTDLQILINQSTATMYWYNSSGVQRTYANFSNKSLYMGGSYITNS